MAKTSRLLSVSSYMAFLLITSRRLFTRCPNKFSTLSPQHLSTQHAPRFPPPKPNLANHARAPYSSRLVRFQGEVTVENLRTFLHVDAAPSGLPRPPPQSRRLGSARASERIDARRRPPVVLRSSGVSKDDETIRGSFDTSGASHLQPDEEFPILKPTVRMRSLRFPQPLFPRNGQFAGAGDHRTSWLGLYTLQSRPNTNDDLGGPVKLPPRSHARKLRRLGSSRSSSQEKHRTHLICW